MLRFVSVFLLALVASAHAQSITVSTAFSISQGFTGNRVPASFTIAIPVTLTLAGAQQSPTGTGVNTAGGTNVAGQTGAQNGTVVGTPQTTAQPTTTTTTSTLPTAPATTMNPSVLAPYPGTTIAGVNLGPGDDYISAAKGVAKVGAALGVTLLGVVVGMQQIVGLI